MQQTLVILSQRLAICRLAGSARLPVWAQRGSGFLSVTRTPDELSIVIDQEAVPEDVECLRGYRAFQVAGTLDPNVVGVLASLAVPLADAGVPIFVVSTRETDYLLVREIDLDRAVTALQAAGHEIRR